MAHLILNIQRGDVMTRNTTVRRQRRRIGTLFAAMLVLVVSACGDDGTGPAASLVGTWNIVGFSDMGVNAATTGTWVFRADGTFAAKGTVAFPGAPGEAVILAGTYMGAGNRR
jgi:hypothetical protein